MAENNNDTTLAETLEFTDDRGASFSFWGALFLSIALIAWMGSGFIFPSEEEGDTAEQIEILPVAVAVKLSSAKPVTQFFQAEGQALPDRDTAIRAETSGQIAEVLVKKGQDVEAGAVIARFETAEKEANLMRARAELERAQRDFTSASTLREQGVATVARVSETEAALATARAQLTAAEEALADTVISAPFAGRIETLSLDSGEYIQSGNDVGRIVDNTPLTVTIQVPQQSLRQLQNNQPARVLFITGEERAGSVSFVGTSAARDTRTFLTEIDVPNADGAIPAGISAKIKIPVGQVDAHFLSPSAVSLNQDGALGVKVVDEDETVRFYPIDVVRAQIEGIWVTGLPETVKIITVGQGYVRDGEIVRSQIDPALKGADK